MSEICANQIRIQLVAYGLIREFRGQTTAGGLGEWVQITEAGKTLMIEEMVIKHDQPSQDAHNVE